MKAKRPEGELVKACLHFLHLRGIFAWRVNSGATVAESKGKRRFVRYQSINGVSDILGVLDGGRILAVECKITGNKPSTDQRVFLDAVAIRGGVAVVAYSVDDVERAIGAKARPGPTSPRAATAARSPPSRNHLAAFTRRAGTAGGTATTAGMATSSCRSTRRQQAT